MDRSQPPPPPSTLPAGAYPRRKIDILPVDKATPYKLPESRTKSSKPRLLGSPLRSASQELKHYLEASGMSLSSAHLIDAEDPPQPTPISSASNRALHARVLRNAKECNRVCAAYDAAYSAPLHSLALSSSSSDEDELQAATANIDEAAAAISHATRAAQIPEPPVAPPRREATPQTHTPQTQTPALRPAADHHAAKAQLRELVRDVSLHLEASSLALADAAQLLARLDAAQPYEQTPEQAVTPRPHYHADSPSHSAHESITEFLTPEFLASFDPERRVPQSLQYDSASQMPPALSPPDS